MGIAFYKIITLTSAFLYWQKAYKIAEKHRKSEEIVEKPEYNCKLCDA